MSKNVILVEDNPFDISLASDAIREIAPHAKLHVIRDGEAALHTLIHRTVSAQIVLLDLTIPRLDGMTILSEIQRGRNRRDTLYPPVIVFSVSAERERMEQ